MPTEWSLGCELQPKKAIEERDSRRSTFRLRSCFSIGKTTYRREDATKRCSAIYAPLFLRGGTSIFPRPA
jgi:hypothetical protein